MIQYSSVVWLTLTVPCFISPSHNHDPPLSVCKGIGHISKQYLHALKPEHIQNLKKKNDRSLKKFSNACKYVLKRYMSYSFVLCQLHNTINGGLAEWMKAHHLQCMQYLEFFFCTLVIIIIVICEQGGRTHNGTFVGSGHGRWSHHWVMSFDPHPLSSVKASITIIA